MSISMTSITLLKTMISIMSHITTSNIQVLASSLNIRTPTPACLFIMVKGHTLRLEQSRCRSISELPKPRRLPPSQRSHTIPQSPAGMHKGPFKQAPSLPITQLTKPKGNLHRPIRSPKHTTFLRPITRCHRILLRLSPLNATLLLPRTCGMKCQRNRQHHRVPRLGRSFPGRLIARPQPVFFRSGPQPRSQRQGARISVRAKRRQTRPSLLWQGRRLGGSRANPTHRSVEHSSSQLRPPQHHGLLFRGPMLGTMCRRSTVMSIPCTSTVGPKAKVSQRRLRNSTCKRRAGVEQAPG